jgi:hypothetical protein
MWQHGIHHWGPVGLIALLLALVSGVIDASAGMTTIRTGSANLPPAEALSSAGAINAPRTSEEALFLGNPFALPGGCRSVLSFSGVEAPIASASTSYLTGPS